MRLTGRCFTIFCLINSFNLLNHQLFSNANPIVLPPTSLNIDTEQVESSIFDDEDFDVLRELENGNGTSGSGSGEEDLLDYDELDSRPFDFGITAFFILISVIGLIVGIATAVVQYNQSEKFQKQNIELQEKLQKADHLQQTRLAKLQDSQEAQINAIRESLAARVEDRQRARFSDRAEEKKFEESLFDARRVTIPPDPINAEEIAHDHIVPVDNEDEDDEIEADENPQETKFSIDYFWPWSDDNASSTIDTSYILLIFATMNFVF